MYIKARSHFFNLFLKAETLESNCGGFEPDFRREVTHLFGKGGEVVIRLTVQMDAHVEDSKAVPR